jgi:hypothetical protein
MPFNFFSPFVTFNVPKLPSFLVLIPDRDMRFINIFEVIIRE